MLIKNKNDLRDTLIRSIIAIVTIVLLAFLLPANLLKYIFPYESGINSFFYIPFCLIFIALYSIYFYRKTVTAILKGTAITLLLLEFGFFEYTLIYYLFMALVFAFSIYYIKVWEFLKIMSEKIANSWKEWTYGSIRIINHGFYVGIGAFFGIFFAGILAGEEYSWAILLFGVVVIVSAALWAQIIEGSEKLKRPFGYYGAIVGIVFGSLAVLALGYNAWAVIGVVTIVMPGVQAIGRLRCLINGCCHGKVTYNQLVGIRYFNKRSRVNNISGLSGELLHPTQLYSILWLAITGIFLLKLWYLSLPASFIFGMYLILTGLGRFVEEAYRGEVQTKIIYKLRFYQWAAIVSVIIGICFTTVNIAPITLNPGISLQIIAVATIGGLFTFFAMGVDFPKSNARFSRLV